MAWKHSVNARSSTVVTVGILCCAAWSSACGGSDVTADVDGGGGSDGATGVDGSTSDATPGDDGGRGGGDLDGSLASFCEGTGPAVVVGDSGGRELCSGRLAERTFRFSLCSCSDIDVPGQLTTDAFDSRTGSSTDAESGAAVGANESIGTSGSGDIGGTLTVAGTDALLVPGGYRVRGDVVTNAPVEVSGSMSVARDLSTAGDVSATGELLIARDLVQPSGSESSGNVSIGGEARTEPVAVAPPCACGDEDLLDVSSIVAWGLENNDNEVAEIDPGVLDSPPAGRIDFPCGRFVLDAIDVNTSVTLRLEGRTVLFVDGSATISGDLDVELAPGAELDMFVVGSLGVSGQASFGDPERPAAVRIYTGTSAPITVSGGGTFVGNLYAPRAPVTLTGEAEVFGSIFAGSVTATGDATVHYDRAILEAGDGCELPPPTMCGGCGECTGGEACIEGMCAACQDDGDCCAPLVCSDGVCGSLLI